MVKRVQLPTVGGIRKSIQIGGSGTTIAELGSGTVTLSQLAALIAQYLGLSPSFAQPPVVNIPAATTTGVNITYDSHPYPSELSVNDEFEFGTTLDTTGARFTSANPWNKLGTYMTTTNLSLVVNDGALIATLHGNNATSGVTSASAYGFAGWYQPIQGSAPWAYTMKIVGLSQPFATYGTGGSNYPGIGLFCATSALGSAVFYTLYNDGGTLAVEMSITSSLATNASGSSIAAASLGNPTGAPSVAAWGGRLWSNFNEMYLQVHTSGSNEIVCGFSPTGYPGTFLDSPVFLSYWNLNAVGLYGITSGNVTIVGMCQSVLTSNSTNASSCVAVVDWFRKTS